MDMFKDKTGEVYKWVVDNCLNGDTEDTDNDLTLGIKCGNKLVAGVVYSNVGKITSSQNKFNRKLAPNLLFIIFLFLLIPILIFGALFFYTTRVISTEILILITAVALLTIILPLSICAIRVIRGSLPPAPGGCASVLPRLVGGLRRLPCRSSARRGS